MSAVDFGAQAINSFFREGHARPDGPIDHPSAWLGADLAADPIRCAAPNGTPGSNSRPADTVVHARTEYVDHAELDERRHLLRLWLTLGD